MILPCRIHRTCNRRRAESLPLALLLAACLLAPLGETMSQEAVTAASEAAGLGWLPAVPLQITAGLDMGYDDNVNFSSTGGGGSLLARENIVLTYARPSQHTQVSLIGVGSFAQYFDLGTDDKNGNVSLSLTHHFSTRLSFYASIYATYATEPDFKSDVGPENVRAQHFDTSNIFSVTYQWLPRLSTVTSYTLQRVNYANSSIGASQDRVENTIDETLQFSLTRRTNLVGEYRYDWINYTAATTTTTPNSVTHYILAGFDHHLTEHLIVRARAGNSFRSLEGAGDSTSPTFDGSLDYTSSNYSLGWTASYGFEAPNTAGVSVRKTWRTGLVLRYNLSSRITSTTAAYYHNDANEGSGTSSVGSQDTLDFLLGLRYTINTRLALHVDYSHTTAGSLGSTPGYSRNNYTAGLSYTY
jgi:hypothetical protein